MSDPAANAPTLTGDQITSLIGGEDPEWRPGANGEAAAVEDSGDETQEEEAETEEESPAEAEDAETEDEVEAKAKPKEEAKTEETPAEESVEDERYNALLAKFELLQEHASRLASQIGVLRQQSKTRPSSTVETEDVDEDRVTKLEHRLEENEGRAAQEAVQGAIIREIEVANARPETAALLEQIKRVAPSFKADFEAAAQEQDPARASRITQLALKAMYAEAKALKNSEARKSAEAVRDRTKTRVAAAKRAAAPTGRANPAANKGAAVMPDSDDPDAIAAAFRRAGRPGW